MTFPDFWEVNEIGHTLRGKNRSSLVESCILPAVFMQFLNLVLSHFFFSLRLSGLSDFETVNWMNVVYFRYTSLIYYVPIQIFQFHSIRWKCMEKESNSWSQLLKSVHQNEITFPLRSIQMKHHFMDTRSGTKNNQIVTRLLDSFSPSCSHLFFSGHLPLLLFFPSFSLIYSVV